MREVYSRSDVRRGSFDFSTLELLRQSHPAWRLLCAKHAPLVASFLHRVFIAPNMRFMAQADLAEALFAIFGGRT